MFWKLASISASSPVEAILDNENFSLEELLDEDEIIQECKALNSRLINFLRDRAQVEQLLRYVIEEPPEDAEHKRVFKFPFISCEIFTCEIDVILKTLVDEEELMNLLFSFLEPDRSHGSLLAGYFSKVVVCLMMRKTVPLMNYVQAHPHVFCQLVDLIGITSIMEVLVRLVGADDHVYPNFIDVMQWLAESNLLEMIVDKLSPSSPPEVHANVAETLCTITRVASSTLAIKLSSPSFVAKILGYAVEDSQSKSTLVNSLSVCISMLDPKRSAVSSSFFHSYRSQNMYDPPIPVSPDTIGAMLPKLGELIALLDVSSDEKVLPTTYGELRPPLGRHRLKIVEFIAVLIQTGNEVAEKELVNSGTIRRVIDLFFEYPYNNALHHHVESILLSCLESNTEAIVDHLLQECDLIGRFLQADKNCLLHAESNQPTLAAAGKRAPRAGNVGHITQIVNKLVHLSHNRSHILACLQEKNEWNEWQATVLQERNVVENVHRWSCGRPTALQDRMRDSDDDDRHDRDYDVTALANNLSQAFGYKIYGNEDNEETHDSIDQDEEDAYFNDDSAEVVISSLRLSDDQGSNLFTNSNWFAFQDNIIGDAPRDNTSSSEMMDDINLNGTATGDSSDNGVVVEEELIASKNTVNGTSSQSTNFLSGLSNSMNGGGALDFESDEASTSHDKGFFGFEAPDNGPLFGDRPSPDCVGCGGPSDIQVAGSSLNPFLDHDEPASNLSSSLQVSSPNPSSPSNEELISSNGFPTTSDSIEKDGDSSQRSVPVPSLFEEDVEFVGVELEGTEKAMEQALKEGTVGEAGPLKRDLAPKVAEMENSEEDSSGLKEFNDVNYWRVDQEVAVLE
ncbi:PREDICTED: serine/threonine-protein phosphatase 6 regulatory subunit 3-like isoform X2 [Lupinus angustifolius]|uniref:serine/threonine-protein phosphatase 6 regulatory subunit 3-like isoform X2 n=1 Tax=Lupinus angustifolius TaxID=3871 RepID=UPI00092E59E4|nr:PREDICTED: serine/threonine-protein phosphatase 6 regulatory subunit 3-like isoform X2 [Lupinus angustifolius]